MKYAIISDIHGNLPALNAVLADAEKAEADRYIFAGDYCMSLPFPNEVIDRIKNMKGSTIIRGNQENYFEIPNLRNKAPENDSQLSTIYWCYNILTKENKSYISKLPKRIDFTDGNTDIYLSHSSADFFGKIILNRFSSSKIAVRYKDKSLTHEKLLHDIDNYLSGSFEFQKLLHTLPDGVYLFGHTHIQWYLRYGNKILINPGSCGLALDFIKTGAPYTLMDVKNQKVFIEERRVAYDKKNTIQKLKSSQLYKQSTVASKIIISQLTTCRNHMNLFLDYAEKYADKIGNTVRPFSHETWENAYKSWTGV